MANSCPVPDSRLRTFVDSAVQGSLLKKMATHWLLLLGTTGLALLVWVRLFEQPELGWSAAVCTACERFLPFFVVSVALVPAFLYDTLKLSHRFAGPILRLRGAMYDAARGRRVAPLTFRRDDFWQDIAEDFNALVELSRQADKPAAPASEAAADLDADLPEPPSAEKDEQPQPALLSKSPFPLASSSAASLEFPGFPSAIHD